jgi:predicted transcriptional regulator
MSATDAASTHLQGMNMNFKEFFSSNPLDFFPRVRKEDPITSFEAADSIKEVTAKHFKIIHECLQTNGPLGKDGIARLTGLESNQVARRLKEMKVLGLITLTGNNVKSNSGRNEREWTS